MNISTVAASLPPVNPLARNPLEIAIEGCVKRGVNWRAFTATAQIDTSGYPEGNRSRTAALIVTAIGTVYTLEFLGFVQHGNPERALLEFGRLENVRECSDAAYAYVTQSQKWLGTR